MNEHIHYSILLSEEQLDFLRSKKYKIDRMECFYRLLPLTVRETTEVSLSKTNSITLQPGQFYVTAKQLERLWGIDRKTVPVLMKKMEDLGIISVTYYYGTTVHILNCLYGWYVNGALIENPFHIVPKVIENTNDEVITDVTSPSEGNHTESGQVRIPTPEDEKKNSHLSSEQVTGVSEDASSEVAISVAASPDVLETEKNGSSPIPKMKSSSEYVVPNGIDCSDATTDDSEATDVSIACNGSHPNKEEAPLARHEPLLFSSEEMANGQEPVTSRVLNQEPRHGGSSSNKSKANRPPYNNHHHH